MHSLCLPILVMLVRGLRCRYSTQVLRRGLNIGQVLLLRHITPVVIIWDMLSLQVLRRLIHHNEVAIRVVEVGEEVRTVRFQRHDLVVVKEGVFLKI